MNLPQLGQPLTDEHLDFMAAFSKSCRRSIIGMTNNSQSGHPGGSLSSIDYLALLYAFIIGETGEKLVVSNGHISPAVYSVLAEMKYIPKDDVVANFRKIGHIYEGHITRHVKGIWFGTGPLGSGISAASGFALAEKLKGSKEKVYGLVGDGESQEGQVYEMMNFAHKYELDNFVVFMDYNKVQLTDSLEEIMPMDFKAIFLAAGWHVIDADAHDFEDMWKALDEAQNVTGKPVIILGHSIMGKGVEFMEPEGVAHKPTWHGKTPKPEEGEEILKTEQLTVTDEERALVDSLKPSWTPDEASNPELLSPVEGVDMGEPTVFETGKPFDCRGAYGKALLDLAQRNKNVLAMTADLRGSVKTDAVAKELPDQHIEVGVAEQHMVSCAGGLSLDGFVPFCSTFGAFMSSRAKDQARVNDINNANVKMVATHCGLSVGEDGPTHQAIDDMGSFLGLFNTMVIEPADANQCDRIIRYVAGHYGNFYVRMGRHKFEVLTKDDGTPFYDKDYVYEYGKCDVIREGSDLTIAASGAMVTEALKVREKLKDKLSIEVVAVSSIKKFDHHLRDSVLKTKKVITLEDHNPYSGLGSQLGRHLQVEGVQLDGFKTMGPTEYQLSGKWNELYESAGIGVDAIAAACEAL
jgi:transketolase